MASFVFKYQNFRYHGNKGRSRTNLNYTVKLHDPENPLYVQKILTYMIHPIHVSVVVYS